MPAALGFRDRNTCLFQRKKESATHSKGGRGRGRRGGSWEQARAAGLELELKHREVIGQSQACPRGAFSGYFPEC